jgi:hypothetical protein
MKKELTILVLLTMCSSVFAADPSILAKVTVCPTNQELIKMNEITFTSTTLIFNIVNGINRRYGGFPEKVTASYPVVSFRKITESHRLVLWNESTEGYEVRYLAKGHTPDSKKVRTLHIFADHTNDYYNGPMYSKDCH